MTESFLSTSWHRVAHLRPRLRGHGQIHRHRYRGHAWYVLQDHASGRMHRFSPAAYQVIGMMDGRRTVDEIWTLVATRLEDDAPSQDEIIDLLSQLHAADMLQADVPPDAAELFDRYAKYKRSLLRKRFTNPMAIKLSLWDPDAFLERTIGLVRPLFGWFGFVVWLAVVVPAIVLAGVHWPELTGDVRDQILAAHNLALMALVYPVVKMLHELGHGYATKAGGGEVHELGIMFLVFFPVPYVDASAATAFRSKARRVAVGAAGMLVESLLAALALYVWLLVEPGPVRAVCYNVMLIAGVSTIVFNGNPLLRFDGYYVLCDLLEIPNLGSRANRFWGHVIDRFAFRTPDLPPFPATTGERVWFLVYAPAAYLYRLIVLFGIVLFVAGKFFFVGVILAIVGAVAGIVAPAAKALGHVMTSPRLQRNRGRAVAVTFATLAAVVAVFAWVPAPLHTTTEGVVWLPDQAHVRAGTDGFVSRLLVEPGHRVDAGEPLVESEEPTLATQIRAAEARVEALSARFTAQQFSDRVQAEITRRDLEKAEQVLERERQRADQLLVRSGLAGTFVVPRAEDLPGRYFRQGEVIGYVALPAVRIIRVVVDQDDVELVRDKLRSVEIKLPDRLEETFRASVVREVPAARDELPSPTLGASGGGRFASDPRDPQGTRVLDRLFQFDMELPTPLQGLTYGSRVHVRFEHGWEPLAVQGYRRLRQLFLSHFHV